MAIDYWPRAKVLEVLRNPSAHDRAHLLKALYDNRYNTGNGDEELLFALLTNEDAGVVASVLYSLWNAYDRKNELAPLVRQLGRGDKRDSMEMPIQSMAISFLKEMAETDASAREELWQIAEDISMADCPQVCAWHSLANLYDVEWQRSYSEEMIMSPNSEKSDEIRQSIRNAVK